MATLGSQVTQEYQDIHLIQAILESQGSLDLVENQVTQEFQDIVVLEYLAILVTQEVAQVGIVDIVASQAFLVSLVHLHQGIADIVA